MNDECLYINKDKNECLKECNGIEFFTNKCKINNNITNNLTNNNNVINSQTLDNLISLIEYGITNKSMDSLLYNLTNGDKNDLLIREKGSNISFQITTSDNQNKNKYDDISSIILGECENKIKLENRINPNQSLLIFKVDYYKQDSKIPIIGYEIFHPVTKKKLNLDCCKTELIKYNIPVGIDENNLFKYDPKSEYYVDQCIPYTTENGTDIILNDRQDEFNNNNMSICESECTFIEYNLETKKSICQCGVKSKQLTISEIVNQTNLLWNNFTKKSQSTNMVSMKCYYTLFTKDGIIKNFASYILLVNIFFFVLSAILFYKCGYYNLENTINEIMYEKTKIKKNNNRERVNVMETTVVKKSKKNKGKNPPKKETKSKKSSKEKQKNILEKSKNKNKNKRIISETKTQNSIIKLKEKILILPNKNNTLKDIKNKKHLHLDHLKNNNFNLNDYELNYLSYSFAKKYDNRSFCNYYCSLIIAKHPIIFTFCHNSDYNSIIIKMNILMISFCLFYFSNALFFNEPVIHRIYEDEGIYNFIFLVPYILYSFIIAQFLIVVIRYIFLSERNIEEIRMEKNYLKACDKIDDVKKCLTIKYISFYISGILFLSFLWYYLSSFGAVYQNTQKYLIINTLISFCFSLIYPFFINCIPAVFRIYSLSSNNSECTYKISKFIQII